MYTPMYKRQNYKVSKNHAVISRYHDLCYTVEVYVTYLLVRWHESQNHAALGGNDVIKRIVTESEYYVAGIFFAVYSERLCLFFL